MGSGEEIQFGDRWYVVIPAYFVVLFPWAGIQAIDFIGPRWKTVKETRRDGRFQFWVALIPLLFIIPYIIFQIMARDFKEMSAAFIAVCFALQHLLRTWWGLWQLREFRSWATESIQILESQGIHYNLELNEEEEKELNSHSLEASYSWRADRIQINETIVDNQVFQGETRCKLVLNPEMYGYNCSVRDDRNLYNWLLRSTRAASYSLRHIMEFAVSGKYISRASFITQCQSLHAGIGHGLRFMKGLATDKKYRRHLFRNFIQLFRSLDLTRYLRQTPCEPTEVLIRWIIAFSAQGMGTWISEFDVIPDPGPPNGVSADFNKRQNYYAREVLASACLLQNDTSLVRNTKVKYGEGHPLQWKHKVYTDLENTQKVDHSSFDKEGKVSRKQMLLYALISGKGLPFGASQIRPGKDRGKVSHHLERSGFKTYQHDIKQIVGSMPANFGNSINKFDYGHLECLTIMLNLGVWDSVDLDSADDYEDYKYFGARQDNIGALSEEDLPISLLKTQIGIDSDSSSLVKVTERCVRYLGNTEIRRETDFGPLPIPILQKGLGKMFRKSSSVLEVSAVIDIWGSLHAGEFVRFVLDQDPDWKSVCGKSQELKRRLSDDGLGLEPAEVIKITGEGSTKLRRTSSFEIGDGDPSWMLSAENKEDMRTAHCALEKMRLAAEFGKGDASTLHIDQTVSFIGVAMESIRSALASGLVQGENSAPVHWSPTIPFIQTKHIKTTNTFLMFRASECFTSAMIARGTKKDDLVSFLKKRSTQIRLVWELQRECMQKLKSSTTPKDPIAMIACILAFPSLQCEVNSDSISIVQEKPHHVAIHVHDMEWCMSIVPTAAPQDVYIEMTISLENGDMTVLASLARYDISKDAHFEWESWRDAFSGRLQGSREWGEQHDLQVLKECTTNADISRGIEIISLNDPRSESKMAIWMGWLPNQPKICEFEMETSVIAEENEASYRRALIEQRVLEIGIVQSQSRQKPPFFSTLVETTYPMKSMAEIIRKKYAEYRSNLRKKGSALSLFELAAGSGYESGLKRAMEILCTEKAGLHDLRRAVSILESFQNNREKFEGVSPELEKRIEKYYNEIVDYSKCDAVAVCALSRFERTQFKFQDKFLEHHLMGKLRKSFMQTGVPEVLEEIIKLCAYCGELDTPKTPLGATKSFPSKVASWGSWLVAAIYNRCGQRIGVTLASENLNRSLFALCRKSEKDFKWMQMVLQNHLSYSLNYPIEFEEMMRDHPPNPSWLKKKMAAMLSSENLEVDEEPEKYWRRNVAGIFGHLYRTGTDEFHRDIFLAVKYHEEAMKLGLEKSVTELESIVRNEGKCSQEIRYKVINAFCHSMTAEDEYELRSNVISAAAKLVHSWENILSSETDQIVDTIIKLIKRQYRQVLEEELQDKACKELKKIVANKKLSEELMHRAHRVLKFVTLENDFQG